MLRYSSRTRSCRHASSCRILLFDTLTSADLGDCPAQQGKLILIRQLASGFVNDL